MENTYTFHTFYDEYSYRYKFQTNTGLKYNVDFFPFSKENQEASSLLNQQGYLLEFYKENKIDHKAKFDLQVSKTIISILRSFLMQTVPEAFVAFYGEQDNIPPLVRKRLFDRWLGELNQKDEFVIMEIDVSDSQVEETAKDFMTIVSYKENQYLSQLLERTDNR